MMGRTDSQRRSREGVIGRQGTGRKMPASRRAPGTGTEKTFAGEREKKRNWGGAGEEVSILTSKAGVTFARTSPNPSAKPSRGRNWVSGTTGVETIPQPASGILEKKSRAALGGSDVGVNGRAEAVEAGLSKYSKKSRPDRKRRRGRGGHPP